MSSDNEISEDEINYFELMKPFSNDNSLEESMNNLNLSVSSDYTKKENVNRSKQLDKDAFGNESNDIEYYNIYDDINNNLSADNNSNYSTEESNDSPIPTQKNNIDQTKNKPEVLKLKLGNLFGYNYRTLSFNNDKFKGLCQLPSDYKWESNNVTNNDDAVSKSSEQSKSSKVDIDKLNKDLAESRQAIIEIDNKLMLLNKNYNDLLSEPSQQYDMKSIVSLIDSPDIYRIYMDKKTTTESLIDNHQLNHIHKLRLFKDKYVVLLESVSLDNIRVFEGTIKICTFNKSFNVTDDNEKMILLNNQTKIIEQSGSFKDYQMITKYGTHIRSYKLNPVIPIATFFDGDSPKVIQLCLYSRDANQNHNSINWYIMEHKREFDSSYIHIRRNPNAGPTCIFKTERNMLTHILTFYGNPNINKTMVTSQTTTQKKEITGNNTKNVYQQYLDNKNKK